MSVRRIVAIGAMAAAVAAIGLFLSLILNGCGGAPAPAPESDVSGGFEQGAVRPRDIKLLADFQNQLLYSRGKRLYFDALELGGSSHIDAGEGLAVYKGGVNEIVDPSFEGSGWTLGPGAVLDRAAASSGKKSLLYTGDGSTRVVAGLKERIPIVSGSSRSLSFDHETISHSGGNINVTLTVFDADGNRLDSRSSALELATPGWQRTGGYIFAMPAGAASYTVEVLADGFNGVCRLDAFLSEPKDQFSPYFDGDSDNCIWVSVATPLNVAAEYTSAAARFRLKAGLLLAAAVLAAATLSAIFTFGFNRRQGWFLVLPFLLGLPVMLLMSLSAGVVNIPHVWPRQATLQGSYLDPQRAYFYRVTALDAEGRESPPSIEVRAVPGWLERKILVTWDKDAEAVKYRVYRGVTSYGQNEVFEVGGDSSQFLDLGESGIPAIPPLELGAEDRGVPHASRSLRPEPDVRISNARLGLDSASDFWVTGEVEFDFYGNRPFRPSSMFEIGNAEAGTQFAVSTRYFPDWGDEYPKILLIKRGRDMLSQDSQALPPIKPGSVIRYVAAQLYEPSAGLPAGVHLWYRIDDGVVSYIFVDNVERLSDWPLIKISKRYYYDEFGNNSICRNFAIIQGRIDERIVRTLMEPGTVPDLLGKLSETSQDAETGIQFSGPQ